MRILRFNEIKHNSSRKTAFDIKNMIIFKDDYLFMIYDPIEKKPIGYITAGLTDYDAYSIYGAYSENGYGPLLYEIAMSFVYPNGITMSDDSGTSYDALEVWKKFNQRKDVKRVIINRDEPSEKEEDLIDGCDGDIECLKDVEEILFLHNHKFIYTLPKMDMEIINDLIKKGEEYLIHHPDINVEYLIYDLE